MEGKEDEEMICMINLIYDKISKIIAGHKQELKKLTEIPKVF